MEKERGKPWDFHTCEVCPYRSKLSFVMYQHSRLHGRRSNTKRFNCNSNTPEKYDCGLCEFEANFKVPFSEHFRVTHEEKEATDSLHKILECYQCKNCNFQTHSVFVLTKHVINCNSNFTHSSKKIEKVKPVKNYSDHWYEFKSESRKQWNYYKCKHCDFQCTLLSKMKKHVRTTNHSDLNGLHFKCKNCFFKAKSKLELDNHILDKHETIDIWIECEHCSYMTTSKKNLNSHIYNKHTKPNVWFTCEQCPFKTKTKLYLSSHMSRKHGTSFKCAQCPFKSDCIKNVEEHTLSVHTYLNDKSYRFKCTQCPFLTKANDGLQRHILHMHSNPDEVTWFKCEQCDHKTKCKWRLRNHVLARHTDRSSARCFQCNLCTYKTMQKSNLKNHVARIHKAVCQDSQNL